MNMSVLIGISLELLEIDFDKASTVSVKIRLEKKREKKAILLGLYFSTLLS